MYFNVFDKIVESEPGLKKYENCDNHFFYAMTNFYKDELDKFTTCMYPCVYCYDDPEEDNQDEINANLNWKFKIFFCKIIINKKRKTKLFLI